MSRVIRFPMRGMGQEDTYGGETVGGGAPIDTSTYTGPPIYADPLPTPGGINWNAILPGIFGTTSQIAINATRPPGVYSTGPQGQTYVNTTPGASTMALPSFGGTGMSSGMLMLIAAAVVIAIVAGGKH